MRQKVSLKNKIVFISGASSGIGEACAKAFAEEGAQLILAARRLEKLQELAKKLNTQTHLIRLDVRDRQAVLKAVEELPEPWNKIDILINNAGLSRGLNKLHEGSIDNWEEMIDTNLKGLLYLSRAIIPVMVSRQKGHIINLGSIAGHQTYPGGNVYCATKAAVRALNEGMKLDLLGTPIRVTSVDPGMVETEFSLVRFDGDKDKAAKVYKGLQPLTPEDIADAIIYATTRPAHVNINEILLMPTAQASANLAHRE
jgi:3-hydroxy acid dehydrogenase/malonic semialdehyde reductase